MYKHILVPIDGSATGEHGLREAIRLAADQKARLRLLHVIDDFPLLVELANVTSFEASMQKLRDYGHRTLADARKLAGDSNVQADEILREVTQARVGDAVVHEASNNGCDLIVMGTHGRRGISRVALGSDAEHVVRTSCIPVLLVRAPQAEATTKPEPSTQTMRVSLPSAALSIE